MTGFASRCARRGAVIAAVILTAEAMPGPLAGGAAAQTPVVAGKPLFGPFGLDFAAMDRSVKPGDDFYRYVNGRWLSTTVIPPDRAEVGAYASLSVTARARVDVLLKRAARSHGSKIGAFYSSYMDEAHVQALGTRPVEPTLTRIDRAPDRRTLTGVMADLQREGVTGLFASLVFADGGEPASNVIYLEQDGLGLPGRHFYVDNDAPSLAGRRAYLDYVARLLALAGRSGSRARAEAVVAFEAEIARSHWDELQGRDQLKTYNRFSPAALEALAPGLDWTAYLGALGVSDQQRFIVREPSTFRANARTWAETPTAVLKDWLLVRYLDRNADLLTRPFVDTHFAFAGVALSGETQIRPRSTRAAALVSNEMADGVGQAYVATYFPPRAKAQIEAIVANVKAAFRTRLAGEAWMAPETREKAVAKLDAFQVVVGYPDRWRDDSGLIIRPGDLVGDVARAERYTYRTMLARLRMRADRRAFDHSAAAPWAWATPTLNEIGFTAAFLQPPYFDADADAAVNYGGIGVVIGHELSHHFDDQGHLYNAEGRLQNWWRPADAERFSTKTQKLVSQYDAYEPLSGLHVNGKLTLGENLADLAGLNISYQAYLQSLDRRPAPVLDGFTGAQRFFLSYAQTNRSKQREADLRNQVLSDPHPPDKERSQEVRNIDAWYAAFDVSPQDKLALPPDARVRIW